MREATTVIANKGTVSSDSKNLKLVHKGAARGLICVTVPYKGFKML